MGFFIEFTVSNHLSVSDGPHRKTTWLPEALLMSMLTTATYGQ
jgi:hypothetical protein